LLAFSNRGRMAVSKPVSAVLVVVASRRRPGLGGLAGGSVAVGATAGAAVGTAGGVVGFAGATVGAGIGVAVGAAAVEQPASIAIRETTSSSLMMVFTVFLQVK
jgi:hypothetical protein